MAGDGHPAPQLECNPLGGHAPGGVNYQNSIIIPNPTFDCYGTAIPANNGEKDLGLCVPEEVALKILTLGIP